MIIYSLTDYKSTINFTILKIPFFSQHYNRLIMNKFLRYILFILFTSLVFSGFTSPIDSTNRVPIPHKYPWADSIIKTMTLEQKIGQLIMIRVYSKENEKSNKQTIDLVSKYNLGGVCMFQGGPVRQVNLINRIQSASKIPVLFSIDGEWGLSMRLDSTTLLPRQMALGAIQDNRLIYKMGKEVARQFLRTGIYLNFAPVADVNSNSKNPVINSRSFGADRENVAQKSIAYMLGMEDHGLLSCAKHFPGHGDTESDSHHTLPIINHSQAVLDSIDLYPFKRLIESGISSVMVAHLFVPALDSTNSRASSLSPKIVHDLLRDKLKFEGLIITDALDMKGASNYLKPGELELAALMADNDILLLPTDPGIAIRTIRDAVDSCIITEDMITEKCLKILRYKEKLHLNDCFEIPTANLYNELNLTSTKQLVRELTESSITVINNKNNILPILQTSFDNYAILSIGANNKTLFQESMSMNGRFTLFNVAPTFNYKQSDSLLKTISSYKTVVVSIHNTSQLPQKGYGVTSESVQFIDALAKKTNVILTIFGNPYILEKFPTLSNYQAIVEAYQPTQMAEESAAQIIMGAVKADGRLPVNIDTTLIVGEGSNTFPIGRLRVTEPSKFEISDTYIEKIDSIVKKAIKLRVFPGCQIAVAYKGEMIINKSYGTPTYIDKNGVTNSDLYDIASITKVLSTTLAIMKLYENKNIVLEEKASHYLPSLKNTNKSNVTISQLLTHNSGLKPFLPFWKAFMKNGVADTIIFKKSATADYQFQVADSMFVNKSIKDSIILKIIESDVDSLKSYQYSDFNFILLKEIVETITQCPINKFVDSVFYAPLNLSYIGYQPLARFPKTQIMPTERDELFRKQVVRGTVHDQTAALMGGVAGHAGLFSNATDVAILMQMLLNDGIYAGTRILKPATVQRFTKHWFTKEIANRRGLGFDKPSREGDPSPVSPSASEKSYGHTGFTGTLVWSDPDYNLTFVFLSNRVYPDAENNRLAKMGIRTEIQELLYQAIQKSLVK